MASKFSFMLILALATAFCININQAIRDIGSENAGEVVILTCEDLKEDKCAFAVSSTGKRCVLEKHVLTTDDGGYTCRSSEIEADRKITNWVETDRCISACGLHRRTFGISSDALLDSHFASKLCSPPCYAACPNVVDLYFNLAAGEGVFLPIFCEAQAKNNIVRREMAEEMIRSSRAGVVAQGPIQAHRLVDVAPPAMAPFPF